MARAAAPAPRPGPRASRGSHGRYRARASRPPRGGKRGEGNPHPLPRAPTDARLFAAEDEVRVVLGHGEAIPARRCYCCCGPAEPSPPHRPRVLAGVRAAPAKESPPRDKTPRDAQRSSPPKVTPSLAFLRPEEPLVAAHDSLLSRASPCQDPRGHAPTCAPEVSKGPRDAIAARLHLCQ